MAIFLLLHELKIDWKKVKILDIRYNNIYLQVYMHGEPYLRVCGINGNFYVLVYGMHDSPSVRVYAVNGIAILKYLFGFAYWTLSQLQYKLLFIDSKSSIISVPVLTFM